MASKILFALFLVAAPGATGSSLRSTPAKTQQIIATNAGTPTKAALASAVPAKVDGIAPQVTQLRAKLLKISNGLTKMLSPEGELAHSKVQGEISKFNSELQAVLKATEKPKDMNKALQQLKDAQAGVSTLAKEITNQQQNLMAEGDSQEESLLLGVLMQKQNEPRSKQMEVLNSPEFAKLKVVVAVIAAKDEKTPLFKQVAAYLDQHSPKHAEEPVAPAIPDKLKAGKDGKPDVTPIVLALEGRLHKMEDSEKRMEEHHQESMKEFDRVAANKTNSKATVHRIKQMKHSEQRQFTKQSALARHDIEAIKSAIDAVKKGDMAALAKAQGALDASMKAAQARTGKFLVLIQMVHRAQGLDCPYCAAQCVDKCHNEGKPYMTCLTDCADAGKA